MKTIYKVTTGSFSSPSIDFYETKKGAYESISYSCISSSNPASVELVRLNDDKTIDILPCWNLKDTMCNSYDEYDNNEDMIIVDGGKEECSDYMLEGDDEYENGAEGHSLDEDDFDYEDLISEF